MRQRQNFQPLTCNLCTRLLVTPAETASILQIILCIVGAALFLFFLGVVIFVYLDKNEETKQVSLPPSHKNNFHTQT